jgi:hypothetical protein
MIPTDLKMQYLLIETIFSCGFLQNDEKALEFQSSFCKKSHDKIFFLSKDIAFLNPYETLGHYII